MTTVLTGRNVTLDIDTTSYNTQTLGATLTIEQQRDRYETLAGPVDKQLDETGTLEVTLLTDWGQTGGLCAALWDAADTSPDTVLPFTMDVGGDTFAGDVLPVKPPAGGAGNEGTEVTITMTVVGKPTRTPAI